MQLTTRAPRTTIMTHKDLTPKKMKRQRRSGMINQPDLSHVPAALDDSEPVCKEPMIDAPPNFSPARDRSTKFSPASASPLRFNLESNSLDVVDRRPSQSDSIAIPRRARSRTFDSGYGGTLSPAHLLGHVSHHHSDGHSMASPEEHFLLDLDDDPLTDDDDVFMDNVPFQHLTMVQEGLISDRVEREDPEELEEPEELSADEDQVDGDDQRGAVEQPEVPWLPQAAGQSVPTSLSFSPVPGAAAGYRQAVTRPVSIVSPTRLPSEPQLSPHSPARRPLMESAFCRNVPSPPSHEDYVLLPAVTVQQTCTGLMQGSPARDNALHSICPAQTSLNLVRPVNCRAPTVQSPLATSDSLVARFQRSTSVNTAPRDAFSRARFFSESHPRARLHSTPEEDHEDDETFVPPRRDRSASMPAVQNQALVRQRFGQELRRISDEFNSIYVDRSSGSSASFPGAERRRSWFDNIRSIFPLITSPSHESEEMSDGEEPTTPVTFDAGPEDEDELDGCRGHV